MSHTGIDLPLERDIRPDDRRAAIELAHAAKLIADCFHFTYLRVITILRFFGRPMNELHQIEARHGPLMQELVEVEHEWERIEYASRQNRET
jgi:hypothetical protein